MKSKDNDDQIHEQEDMAAFELVMKALIPLCKESQERIVKTVAVFFEIKL